jgi:hypothetical protein
MGADGKTSQPVPGNNPMGMGFIIGMNGAYTGLMWAALKYADPEARLSFLPIKSSEAAIGYFVLLAGLLQSHMSNTTNWARLEYKNPWPYMFALEKNPKKIEFDCVQRAHVNFTENYTQLLAMFFFASKLAPRFAAVCGTFHLLGRLVFANGYYTGVASNKDKGTFGYFLGTFPLVGLFYLWVFNELGLMAL